VFDQCDRIIVATDAGREGELIFRYIFHYLSCHKPFVRLWISSLTDRAIREGMENLQPGERYDNLYLAATPGFDRLCEEPTDTNQFHKGKRN